MNRFIFFFAFAIFLSSCSPSKEEVVNDLIAMEVCNGLVDPTTYESISTSIDSAFTPGDDPFIYRRIELLLDDMDDLVDKKATLDSLDLNVSLMKSYLDFITLGNLDKLEKLEGYKDTKAKIDEVRKLLRDDFSKSLDSLKKQHDTLAMEMNRSSEFCGFRAVHRYRAQDPDGKKYLDTVHFFIDRDLKEVWEQVPDAGWRHFLYSKDVFEDKYVTLMKYLDE